MKALPLSLLAACSIVVLLPHAASTQDTKESRLHYFGVTPSTRLGFTAGSILREDPPNPGPSPLASLVHLHGNVEVRTCCVQLPASKENPNPPSANMIIQADEADYHADTGEIEARGTVRISFLPK